MPPVLMLCALASIPMPLFGFIESFERFIEVSSFFLGEGYALAAFDVFGPPFTNIEFCGAAVPRNIVHFFGVASCVLAQNGDCFCNLIGNIFQHRKVFLPTFDIHHYISRQLTNQNAIFLLDTGALEYHHF